MAKTDFQTVDEYLETLPQTTRDVLETVRQTIQEAVPDAEEAISYQIPTFKLGGKTVIHFAGWKNHYSLYPAPDDLILAFEEELAAYEKSRGTIRFPLSAPVPVDLIERIAKFRAESVRSNSG